MEGLNALTSVLLLIGPGFPDDGSDDKGKQIRYFHKKSFLLGEQDSPGVSLLVADNK